MGGVFFDVVFVDEELPFIPPQEFEPRDLPDATDRLGSQEFSEYTRLLSFHDLQKHEVRLEPGADVLDAALGILRLMTIQPVQRELFVGFAR
mgnify:CR=1 FL=1